MAFRRLQVLSKHGSSSAVVIPVRYLERLDWICGTSVVVELNENCDRIIIRKPEAADFPGPNLSRRAETLIGAER